MMKKEQKPEQLEKLSTHSESPKKKEVEAQQELEIPSEQEEEETPGFGGVRGGNFKNLLGCGG